MKPSIMHVARKIMEMSSQKPTPLKLQKLAYYCQAWSLAWEEKPLFDDEFEAWANGPVNHDLFNKHKGVYTLGDDFLSEYSGFEFDEKDKETIAAVLSFYDDKDPFYLSELTHKERPWRDARGNTPLGAPSNAVISKESMQDYYTGIS